MEKQIHCTENLLQHEARSAVNKSSYQPCGAYLRKKVGMSEEKPGTCPNSRFHDFARQ